MERDKRCVGFDLEKRMYMWFEFSSFQNVYSPRNLVFQIPKTNGPALSFDANVDGLEKLAGDFQNKTEVDW